MTSKLNPLPVLLPAACLGVVPLTLAAIQAPVTFPGRNGHPTSRGMREDVPDAEETETFLHP